MPLIKLEDVSFSYENNKVIENLNFEVEKGDYLCVLGTNGSGKSTLLKGILGLVPKMSGMITKESITIGYLPQQTAVQKDFPVSSLEVVKSGRIANMKRRPFFSKDDLAATEQIMKKLDIWDIRRKSFRDLSGGQRQRVLLARALVSDSELLLLDEPVAALDPVVTNNMYELLEELNKKSKNTIIMVSHDVDVARRGANKILHIAGSQLYFGSAEEYLKTDLAKHYLGGCGSCH